VKKPVSKFAFQTQPAALQHGPLDVITHRETVFEAPLEHYHPTAGGCTQLYESRLTK
jgi:hypothetical protein